MKKDLRYQPRFAAQLKAFFGGYFWLPCPICRENFGGFEASQEGLSTSYAGGCMVCLNCGGEAEKENKKNNYFIPESRSL